MLAMVFVTLFSSALPFFWDTILYSRIAHWFIDSNFTSLIPPENLDTGNQPFFALLLAAFWKITGKSLWSAHLLILPFLIITAVQYFRLLKYFVPTATHWIGVIVFLSEPVFLAQSTMVSLDIIILSLYLLALNSILHKQKGLLLLSTCLLALTNTRGILLICPLMLSHTYLAERRSPPDLIKITLFYLPALLTAMTWIVYHYQETGWWLTQPAEWSRHRQLLGLTGMLRNLLFILWRLFDFGQCILIVLAAGLWMKKRRNISPKEKDLLILILIPFTCLVLFFIPFSNPIGHRYLLVVLVLIPIAFSALISPLKALSQKVLAPIILMAFLAGQCFFYPPPFSNGWDSTIAHLYYFKARDEMKDFILSKTIKPENVGVDFPCDISYRYTNLVKDIHFSNKIDGGIEAFPYVLQSNINNKFNRPELEDLSKNWTLVKEIKNGPVYMRLYKNPTCD